MLYAKVVLMNLNQHAIALIALPINVHEQVSATAKTPPPYALNTFLNRFMFTVISPVPSLALERIFSLLI